MNKEHQQRVLSALMERHGQTFSEAAGISLKNTPAPLFQLLTLSLLCSARISANQAVHTAHALFDAGLTTAEKMAEASWQERVDILNKNGYARYDESTSRMLQDTSDLVLDEYCGDLRELRSAANKEPKQIKKLLTEFKGIGPTGAEIFLREVQVVWSEIQPFLDDRALEGAGQLGLPQSIDSLTNMVDSPLETARLASALVRTTLAKDADDILKVA